MGLNNHSSIIHSYKVLFIYQKILSDLQVCSFNIGSMEEFCLDMKFIYIISIEKLAWIWKGLDLQDGQYIIAQFSMHFILFE